MVRLIVAVAALLLSGCGGISDCSSVGHVWEIDFGPDGGVVKRDAGWRDAGWWYEATPGVVCVPPELAPQ